MDASTSFRVSVDRKSNLWNLKNINVVDNNSNKSKHTSNFTENSESKLSRSVSNLEEAKEPFGLKDKRLSRQLSSSTSYLNEQDDYDDDMNKMEYVKKFKRQLSLEKIEKEPSVTGLNGSLDEDLNKNQSSDSDTHSGS